MTGVIGADSVAFDPQYETVEGWSPSTEVGIVQDDGSVGPDHPDYPLASDDLDDAEPRRALEPCGAENRVRKRQTDVFPWSAICYLIITKVAGFGAGRDSSFLQTLW